MTYGEVRENTEPLKRKGNFQRVPHRIPRKTRRVREGEVSETIRAPHEPTPEMISLGAAILEIEAGMSPQHARRMADELYREMIGARPPAMTQPLYVGLTLRLI